MAGIYRERHPERTGLYRVLFYYFDETDPLLCSRCGGQMSIISFIEDHKVIDKIIFHLKLIFMAERPPPQRVRQELLMAAEERGDYF